MKVPTKVKFVQFLDKECPDITIGNIYTVTGVGYLRVRGSLSIVDDAGQDNEIYKGEYKIVEEDE